jgi:hypothetical protein
MRAILIGRILLFNMLMYFHCFGSLENRVDINGSFIMEELIRNNPKSIHENGYPCLRVKPCREDLRQNTYSSVHYCRIKRKIYFFLVTSSS